LGAAENLMTQHEAQNEKILDQFTRQAESYAKLTESRASGSSSTPFFDAISPLETDCVLDVACGTGRISVALAKRTRHVTGIDLTEAMITQARALQAQSQVTNLDWHVGDVLPLPFADCSFSLVISQAAFHHLAEPTAVLREMARVCSDDGRIAINDMSPDAATADALNSMERLRDPSHVRARPPAELVALGSEIGLVAIASASYVSPPISLESILDTSFPNPGDLEKVRALFRDDAQSGANALGLRAAMSGEKIMVQYPMTSVVWRRDRLNRRVP
jgi:ubiquinone/menaquinone biosynthesis C-methylase UbiE